MRNVGLDLARGILMMYIIIIIHGVFWLNLLPRPYSSILLIEMPLIFFISGLAYSYTVKSSNITLQEYIHFIKTRAARILIPYFVYAITCILFILINLNDVNIINLTMDWLNPFKYGGASSIYLLNWHLWFIPPFLAVTLVLPLIRLKIFSKIPDLIMLLATTVAFLLFDYLNSVLSIPAFYFIWTVLGYKVGKGLKMSVPVLMILSVISSLVLLLTGVLNHLNLDMQTNKFPPNYLFLLFSIGSFSLIYCIATRINPAFIQSMAKIYIMKWFILYGYSLYLWQGLGYSIAIICKEQFDINIVSTWTIAVFTTIILGRLFSPFENNKFPIFPKSS